MGVVISVPLVHIIQRLGFPLGKLTTRTEPGNDGHLSYNAQLVTHHHNRRPHSYTHTIQPLGQVQGLQKYCARSTWLGYLWLQVIPIIYLRIRRCIGYISYICDVCFRRHCQITHTHTQTHRLSGWSRMQMADRILTASTIMCGTLGVTALTRRGMPSADINMAFSPCWERERDRGIWIY